MCLNVILHKLCKFHYNQTINDMIFLPWIRGKMKVNISSVLRKESNLITLKLHYFLHIDFCKNIFSDSTEKVPCKYIKKYPEYRQFV